MIKGLPFSTRDNVRMGQQPLTKGVIYSLVNTSNSNNVINIYNDSIRIQGSEGASAAKLIVTPTDYFEIGASGWYIAK